METDIYADTFETQEMDFEECKKEMQEEGREPKDDNAVWGMVSDIREDEWRETKRTLHKFLDCHECLLSGVVGRWNGDFEAGTVFKGEDIEDILSKAFKDCVEIRIYDDNGKLCIWGVHHDGRVYFEIRILTAAGEAIFDNWESGYGKFGYLKEEQMHEKLFDNPRLSRPPRIAKNEYGVRPEKAA